ncbi:MAG: FemAB family XrtA/PEP-CTERM system-associated protein [Rhodospirillaceae bacterium]
MIASPEHGIVVRALDDVGKARWDAYVDGCPDATFFHRAGWKEVIEKTFGHQCHFLHAERNGAICGVLPLVLVKSVLFGKSLVSTGFTVGGGPAVDDDATLAALDARAIEIAEAHDVDMIEYRVRTPAHPGWKHKSGLYVGFRREIDPDIEKNMLAIPRKQRAMVRKGIGNGLVSETETDPSTLHHIYAVSVRNLGTPVYPRAYFGHLMRVFGDEADIVTVRSGGVAVASVMNFYFRDECLPYYGGGLAEARPVAANDFMYWEVMRRACERGFRWFDFGRSKEGTGAYSFKKNWGFAPQPWTYEYYLRKVDDIPDINPLNPKYRYFIAGWKRLPVGLSKLLGPLIVRGLG